MLIGDIFQNPQERGPQGVEIQNISWGSMVPNPSRSLHLWGWLFWVSVTIYPRSLPVSVSYFSALNIKKKFTVSLICFRHSTRLSESYGEVPQQTEEKDQLCRQPKGKAYSSLQ